MHRFSTSWLRVALVVAGLALPFRAAAEGPPPPLVWGEIEAGAYRSTEDSYPWGEFTGIKDDAWYGLADFDIEGRAPWDGDETWNFHAQGKNLALDSRWLRLEGGFQGLFDLWLEWDQIPRFVDDTARTVFQGRGSGLLTLPQDWVPSDTTTGFTALGTSLRRLNVYRERRDLRTGAALVLPRGFELDAQYEWERREGRRVTGAMIGNTGGNPRTSLVPEPIDWTTHEADGTLRWAGERLQLQVGYEFSRFDNGEESLTFQNPYAAIGGWSAAAGFPAFGRKALEPDNHFHQVSASGGYSLPWRTRIMANFSYGWFRQDEQLLPYTVNPDLVVTRPLPRGRADAKIDATNVGVRITSRPLDRLRISAGYRFDDRDNDTPRDVFLYVPADSSDQPASLASNRARLNLPNSYRLHEGRIDVGYELFRRTELSAGYERQREERSWTETDRLDDDIFRVGLRSRALRWADLRIDGVHWKRDAGDYFHQAPVVWGFAPEYVATVSPLARFENVPPFRKFSYTDRDRSSIDARVALLPLDTLSFGGNVGWTLDEYDGSELGLRERRNLHWGLDATWSPLTSLTAYAWFQRERYESELRARQFNNTAAAFASANDWRALDADDIDSVGAGAEWTLLDDRLRLRADYALSWSKERVAVDTGPGLAPALPLPDARTYIHDVSFSAEVRVVDGLRARFGYLFQHLDQNDWATDGVAPATITTALGLGQSAPDHAAHLFAFSLIYEFSLAR
jgi:MtrB/PioB family decaheme-associated outer membrane protein